MSDKQFDRFQGDPALFLEENGAYMVFKGGQPVMDQGLENATKISILTKEGWWGNDLETEESKKIGSNYQDIGLEPITLNNLTDLEESAARALKWMTEKGLAVFDISVNNPNGNRRDCTILIQLPGKELQTFLLTENGLLWKAQAEFPAHERE
jgi:phage gp46-like protein